MRKFVILISVLFMGLNMMAQVPEKMSYQAIVRDAGNNLVTNQEISVRLSILQGTMEGNIVYVEDQNPITNENGLISIEFGGEYGFDSIDWANGPFYLKTEIDPSGGNQYSISGTSQLLTVPYALYARYAQNNPWSETFKDISYSNGMVGIGTDDPQYLLDIKSDMPDGLRTLVNIENLSHTRKSYVALELRSGSEVNYTRLNMVGDDYDYSWWGKHGILKTVGEGLVLEATKATSEGGEIIFVNGSSGPPDNIKKINMIIDGDGQVGIGTNTPAERLQIKSGDIYLEDINSGVIMTSPDGNCWRMTVDNTGNAVFTAVECPSQDEEY